ncbi:hypothetical protein NE237_013747 [Protea cynaroides]|uniref:Uncharacterized protein n=1 Tax=Protea cynaroides TaxID=273540 RepID=A0A9Q0H4H3_9MAGN|nr:hypothetical protein NE237_013747 [Protea cynaroides]
MHDLDSANTTSTMVGAEISMMTAGVSQPMVEAAGMSQPMVEAAAVNTAGVSMGFSAPGLPSVEETDARTFVRNPDHASTSVRNPDHATTSVIRRRRYTRNEKGKDLATSTVSEPVPVATLPESGEAAVATSLMPQDSMGEDHMLHGAAPRSHPKLFDFGFLRDSLDW